MQRRYGLSKRKPQLTTSSRKKAAVGDSCVKVLEKLRDTLIEYGYMTENNELTELGKLFVIALDETSGKQTTKSRKVYTTDGIAARRAKTETPPHVTVVAAHNFAFTALQPLVITAHKFGCSKCCADAIKRAWPEALIASTENGYIQTDVFLNIH